MSILREKNQKYHEGFIQLHFNDNSKVYYCKIYNQHGIYIGITKKTINKNNCLNEAKRFLLKKPL